MINEMSNLINKPKLPSAQLVAYMKNNKGIRFDLVSETEAAIYFTDSNNYLRTASYRKNYQKHTNGINDVIGKYIDLDFAYLKELSAIDFRLRRIILNMSVNIEHDIKVNILKEIIHQTYFGINFSFICIR